MNAERTQERRGYLAAFAICLAFVTTRYFEPGYFDNEWSYSINPIKILHPDYLKFDFFFDRVYPYFIVYDGAVSLLYKYFDFLTATLVCRVLIWAFQLWALARLCRTLQLAWWSTVLVVVFWLDVTQSLVAGEWIIGSASAKPVAYGIVFLALDSLLRERTLAAGILSGTAISFHVLVGGWSFLAMVPALVWAGRGGHRLRNLAIFSAAALVFALPGLVPALKDNLMTAGSVASATAATGSANEVARLSVRMATPFHLDPGYFLSGPKVVKLVLFIGVAFLLGVRFIPSERFSAVAVFLGCLVAFFLSGLVAWRFEWYRYLQYYPFRVADGILPLFFWVGVVAALQNFAERRGIHPAYLFLAAPVIIGIANVCLVPVRAKSVGEMTPRNFATTLLATEPRLTAYWIRERIAGWYRFAGKTEVDDVLEMETWIRDHTPRDSIFIAPPWKHSFALRAQRAQFVTPLKYIPSNHKIVEWKRRMEMLNRGPLKSVGRELWDELPKNYGRISEAEVRGIKECCGAEYFLAPTSLKLALPVVRSNVSWILYGL